MVKIPSYDDMKKVQMSDQGAQGFSGGQIQVASDTGLTSFGRGMQNMGETMAKIEVDKQKKESTLWNSSSYEKVFKEYNF